MRIARHRLHREIGEAYDFRSSPNRGGNLDPEYLVIHYTAGRSLEESVDWLARKESRASAHVVIGRDGSVVQQVPFDTIAWHAGPSSWEGRIGLNRCSIGIELDNAGRLVRQGNRWRAWFGGYYDDDDVIEATHRHESTPAGWHTYTPAQLQAALDLSTLLVGRYNLRDVIGHDDISPGRKSDPGPAFPMDSFRSRIFGRREDEMPEYYALAALNIRTGPGTRHEALPGSPLPPGTRMQVIRAQDSWRLVDVLDVVNGIGDLEGWVHSRFIANAPRTARAAEGDAIEVVIQ
jgi:N-acetylmuramoyl-L-alanine amidase